jgi:hypothetical protein
MNNEVDAGPFPAECTYTLYLVRFEVLMPVLMKTTICMEKLH